MLAAVVPGRHQLIGWLLKQGADPNARRKNGGTALMHAALNGDSPSAVLLLRSGADIRVRLDRGETVMTLAEKCANKQRGEEVLKILGDAEGKR
jgi:ankyrin repeat protein